MYSSDISRPGSFQHTAARRRLLDLPEPFSACIWFQHTAARRRLVFYDAKSGRILGVSTHSRPKAAGVAGQWFPVAVEFQHTAARRRLLAFIYFVVMDESFNTQPPEGGWPCAFCSSARYWFQHTAARRRLSLSQKPCSIRFRSPDFAKLPRKARTRV